MRKLLFLCSLVLVLGALAAVAESAEINVTVIDNAFRIGQEGKFNVSITNLAKEIQRFSLYSLQAGQGWTVDPSPPKDRIIEVAPKETYYTTIRVRALENFAPGIYTLNLDVASDLGEKQTKLLKIYLSPEQPYDYLPAIKVAVDMNDKVDPREPVSIKLLLENRNPLDLANLVIKVQSDIPEFAKEAVIDLPPLEKKTVEFSVIPNRFQQPKDYVLFFVFLRAGQPVKVVEKKIEIVALMPAFKTDVTEVGKYFKIFKEVTITNEGNVLNTQKARAPLTRWESYFTYGEGDVVTFNDAKYVEWELTLGPGEATTKHFITNLRIPLYVLIFLLLFTAFYFYVLPPISVSKSAVTTQSDEEGALSEIKVALEVKNTSSRPVRSVALIDYVPGIANVEKMIDVGTLKPTEVTHTARGTKLVWNIAELEGKEHRVITYKVKAKLNILGTFSLPRATAEYGKRKGRTGKAYSNIFRLST